ncbi:hypothetical protein ANN_08073 [Periplaneta americana]|uniref:HAT C-terminal dimerisation domain-containing protein n=1 Tax=Periplaneta americana TaxID=6978 RepID=A0ABQ8T1X8_PERAM|nr:hypothetical protein ANN_08073 [Periplaneta americana]
MCCCKKQIEPSRSNSERNISDIDIDIPDIVYYSYASITSCHVERSFSRYNFCLSERRRTLTFDNLCMYIIVHCNAQTTKNDAETDQEEKKELVGSLAEKKLRTEGCTGSNGEREKSSGQKKISDDGQH